MLQISRACAAIDILDNYINGIPIEKALKEWFKKTVLLDPMIEEVSET